jgi:hypothetical protein
VLASMEHGQHQYMALLLDTSTKIITRLQAQTSSISFSFKMAKLILANGES